jgi:hypothetical protein
MVYMRHARSNVSFEQAIDQWRGTMSVGLVMRFTGVGADKYDEVMRELDLPLHDNDNANWPAGIISHVAGATQDGWCVVDTWDTQAAFDKFMTDKLGPITQKLGLPAPDVTPFQVYNAYRHGR